VWGLCVVIRLLRGIITCPSPSAAAARPRRGGPPVGPRNMFCDTAMSDPAVLIY
jgi:hypothetical protein